MTRIHIANMACGGCAKGVIATVQAANPGAEVTVDLSRREVSVRPDNMAGMVAALCAAGWDAKPAAP